MKYVGQTGKELSVRLNQHKYCVRTGQMSSALFVHMNNFNHQIDWANSNQIVNCKNIIKRNIIESAFIKVCPQSILNISPGMYKLDPLIVKEIVNQFKFIT